MKTIFAELNGRDLISAQQNADGSLSGLEVVGCREFLDLVRSYKMKSADPTTWPMPTGVSHGELLLKEFLLKLAGKFEIPYLDEEICHCRVVPTKAVDQAIVAGAHTTEQVSRATTASTSCGTCRPDVQQIIDYRLTGA